ncbi:class D beta-lactamase [Nocardiopsis aegyptia]|uniref:class D beta-lactamase n=1 Tax=Nocardiopsis aegyptia TaxID=220378 RepID=UPI0036710F16
MGTDIERPGRPAERRSRLVVTAGCALALTGVVSACAEESEGPRPEQVSGSVRGDVTTVERADLEAHFADAGLEGTFVLYDADSRVTTVVDPEQAAVRQPPASTFKIPNTLIGLQTGAVADVDEVLPYGGEPQPVAEWEQDMGLRDAFPLSNVPVYQELARRVGHEPMAAWVDRLDYGNREVGGPDEVDRFWLEGPLEVSAQEQTEFLSLLARKELPVDTAHQEAVHEIALVEEAEDYRLYAKSGWGADVEPSPGWWVGWVESGSDVHTFALRVEIEEDADAELREPLARDLLAELEVLPPEAA